MFLMKTVCVRLVQVQGCAVVEFATFGAAKRVAQLWRCGL